MNWKAVMFSFKAQWVISLTWRCRIGCQMEVYGPNWEVDPNREILSFMSKHWESSHNLDFSFSWNIGVETVPMHLASPSLAPNMRLPVSWSSVAAASFKEDTCFPSPRGHTSACFSRIIYGAVPEFATPCLDSLGGSFWDHDMGTICFRPLIGLTDYGYCLALLCVTQRV